MRIAKQKNNKKTLVIVSVCLALIVLGVIGYFFIQKHLASDREDKYGSSNTTPTENVPKPTEQTGSDSSTIGNSKDTTDSSAETTVVPGQKPATPIGTFVSNHKPNLSGSPAPNSINSTCSTTAGVQCVIEFSNGSTTKSLPTKIVDADGNISWDWKLQDVGLTEGSWIVKAIAKNGTVTSESTDPVKLEVRQ